MPLDPYPAVEVEVAIEDLHDHTVEVLAGSALAIYIAESFNTLNDALKAGLIPDETYEVLKSSEVVKIIEKKKPPAPVITAYLGDFTEVYRPAAQTYADTYKADLTKGGRIIRKGRWGEYDTRLGYRPYSGYDEVWEPWLSRYTEQTRTDIHNILHTGNVSALWPDTKEKYTKGSLADELSTYFDSRRSHASTVARTETQHQRAMARNERWDKLGYTKFRWVCAHGPNSPCEDLCSQFCGEIYSKADLPFAGDKAHPNCMCEVIAVIDGF